jgi:hypothetical protein
MKRERSKGRISPTLEALLKRMLASNARVRLTAAEVCKDSYWIIPLRMCILSVIFYTLIANIFIPADTSSQEHTLSKRRFSIFSELSSKSGTIGKRKIPSRAPLGDNKGPTPTSTPTIGKKATKGMNWCP